MEVETHRKQADPRLPYNPAPSRFTCVFIGLSFDTPYLVELCPPPSSPHSIYLEPQIVPFSGNTVFIGVIC